MGRETKVEREGNEKVTASSLRTISVNKVEQKHLTEQILFDQCDKLLDTGPESEIRTERTLGPLSLSLDFFQFLLDLCSPLQ